jgi:hypothetical protein
MAILILFILPSIVGTLFSWQGFQLILPFEKYSNLIQTNIALDIYHFSIKPINV